MSDPTPNRPLWSEGICGDGAAILRDGVMVPVEEVIAELNRLTALAQPAPGTPTDGELVKEFGEAMCTYDGLDPVAIHFARAVLARWGQQ